MKKRGFTLIELLSVMAIMMIIAGIAIGSYFNITRGAAMRSAVAHLQSMLLLARQNAVMNGHSTYVVFDAEGGAEPVYAVCMEDGRVTYAPGGGRMADKYADWSNLSTNGLVYNLTRGESYLITMVTDTTAYGWMLNTDGGHWSVGDRYGWEVHPRTAMPRGFELKRAETVIFNPDGTTRVDGYDLGVVETINPDYEARVIVEGLTGFVKVIM